MSTVVLSVRDLGVRYGNIQAVRGISFEVEEGEIVALIGANGAGKSSILRAISGIAPYSGEIVYGERNLRGVTPDRIVALGIAQVPEGRGIFGNLTVGKTSSWRPGNARTGPALHGTSSAFSISFLASGNAGTSREEPSPEANSRCLPSAAP